MLETAHIPYPYGLARNSTRSFQAPVPPAAARTGRSGRDTDLLVDWDSFDPAALFEAIRERGPAPDAEQTIWAFERALHVARTDAAFVEHLVVASVCLLAYERGQTPRTILEQMFRRSVSDLVWSQNYAQFASE